MQEILLPDYLDGSVIPKHETLKMFKLVCAYAKYMQPTSATEMAIDLNSATREEIPPDVFLEIIKKDESMKVFLRSYHGYISHPHKNYVVARTLTEAFAETKLDIKGKYLPKDFTGYFEIRGLKDNDGDEIKGVFVRIDHRALTLGFIMYNSNKNYTVGHFNSEMPEDEESIADKIRSLPYTITGYNFKNKRSDEIKAILQGGGNPDIVLKESEYYKHLHIILNAVLYVTHNENLKEEINNFSHKKSKREGEMRVYTQRPYIFVGRNFQVPRKYMSGDFEVRGHWRWQPYGLGRSLIKHIFIDPYVKSYDKE